MQDSLTALKFYSFCFIKVNIFSQRAATQLNFTLFIKMNYKVYVFQNLQTYIREAIKNNCYNFEATNSPSVGNLKAWLFTDKVM